MSIWPKGWKLYTMGKIVNICWTKKEEMDQGCSLSDRAYALLVQDPGLDSQIHFRNIAW